MFLVTQHLDSLITSARLASDTPSLRSMSVPSDLQRGREELVVVVVVLIRWAAMSKTAVLHELLLYFFYFLLCVLLHSQQLSMIFERQKILDYI